MTETIYGLLPPEPAVEVKPPMYRSKHNPNYALAGSTLGSHGTTRLVGAAVVEKKTHRTFGERLEEVPRDPAKFLKRGSSVRKGPGQYKSADADGSPFKYAEDRKDPVPRRDDRPIIGILSKTNFLTANAVDAILAVPRCPNQTEVNYLEKEDYGKIPNYLEQVKDEISRENTMIDTFVREQMGLEQIGRGEVLDELPDREREELIDALKAKWDSVNKKYQLMAHMVNLDTFGKVRRKEHMERQLKELEGYILKIERTPVLLSP